MDTLRKLPSAKPSPLQQARTHERVATYSIALIVGIVAVLIASTVMVASTESPDARVRIVSAMAPVAQIIVALATLALVRHQVSVTVGDIEQAEQTESRLLQLTAAIRALMEVRRRPFVLRKGSVSTNR
jgi:NADH:ubiquinone oxidoreductase subunit 6 (subunit J)